MSYLSRHRQLSTVIVSIHAEGDDEDTVAILAKLEKPNGDITVIGEWVSTEYWPSLATVLTDIDSVVGQPKIIEIFTNDDKRYQIFKKRSLPDIRAKPLLPQASTAQQDEALKIIRAIDAIWQVCYRTITYKRWRWHLVDELKTTKVLLNGND